MSGDYCQTPYVLHLQHTNKHPNRAVDGTKAVGEPEKIKRPWLSIIKQLCKVRYKITRKDHRIYKDDGIVIRTILYHFQDI